jgi:putative redox protein
MADMDDIEVTFPGGRRVDARVGPYLINTDRPIEAGGDGTAPGALDLFLASLATCAGVYVVDFCRSRGLSTDGIRLREHVEVDETTKLPRHIRLDLTLPASFPDKYRTAVVRAAEACKVRKTIAAGPMVDVVLANGSPTAHPS